MATLASYLESDQRMFAIQNAYVSRNDHPIETVIEKLNVPALINCVANFSVPTHVHLPCGSIPIRCQL